MYVTYVKTTKLRWIVLKAATVVSLFAPGTALADSAWERLDANAIKSALTGRALVYENGAEQSFDVSGQTSYISGRPSLGYWSIRGDHYCSVWPPSDLWACYQIEVQGEMLRFIGKRGDVTVGKYKEE
ncbi:hypothetical protein [Epibacterium ulvae]|uniref:hypothetical protein n=1 Tax=Epibacterium ulvae TaxID=1156985 RepID=UPI0024937450|nr:hypothetical protein [Epibacterium ulvae]